jgi:hypothetical protein
MAEKHSICTACGRRVVWSSRRDRWLHVRPWSTMKVEHYAVVGPEGKATVEHHRGRVAAVISRRQVRKSREHAVAAGKGLPKQESQRRSRLTTLMRKAAK